MAEWDPGLLMRNSQIGAIVAADERQGEASATMDKNRRKNFMRFLGGCDGDGEYR
jgi:hypothetical protein